MNLGMLRDQILRNHVSLSGRLSVPGGERMAALSQDLRFAIRQILRNHAYTT